MSSRHLPLAGVVFGALLVVAVVGFGGSAPDSGAAGEEVARLYEDEGLRHVAAAYLLAAAAPFVLFFALAFAARTSGDAPWTVWERLLTAGGAVAAAVILVAAWVHYALVEVADDAAPQALQALNAADANTWLPFSFALGLLLLGAAGAVLTRRLLPGWVGWSALLLGVAAFVPYAGFFALVLGILWIALVGVLLSRAR